MTTSTANTANIREYSGHTVRLMKRANGQRFARISEGGMTVELPTQMLAMGAGKDAWMRGVIVKCTGCRCEDRVEHLNQGLYCEDCASEGIEY